MRVGDHTLLTIAIQIRPTVIRRGGWRSAIAHVKVSITNPAADGKGDTGHAGRDVIAAA